MAQCGGTLMWRPRLGDVAQEVLFYFRSLIVHSWHALLVWWQVTAKLDKLVFATQPLAEIVCDEAIEPPITVFAAPGLSDEVELVVHGGAIAQGETKAKLVPHGKNPSSASFSGVTVSPEGR